MDRKCGLVQLVIASIELDDKMRSVRVGARRTLLSIFVSLLLLKIENSMKIFKPLCCVYVKESTVVAMPTLDLNALDETM